VFFNLIALANTMHTDSFPTIGVVAALPGEARVLTRVADNIMQRLPVKGRIVVRQSGIGLQAARRQAEYLAEISELLVSLGVSGGLHPALKTGDLVLADQVLAWNPEHSPTPAKRQNDKPGLHELSRTQALPVSFRADTGLINYIAEKFHENTIHFFQGPVLCSTKPISTAASKLTAHRLTGALAADMDFLFSVCGPSVIRPIRLCLTPYWQRWMNRAIPGSAISWLILCGVPGSCGISYKWPASFAMP
jgi:nucleoside phosphorylase